MHTSSLENMQKCYERFIHGRWSRGRGTIRVLDIGGADVNGSYADIFSEAMFDYVAADAQAAPGVQLVLEDPYTLPHEDESVDLIISGQTFEHVEFFWELFREMSRAVKPDGFIFLIAPSAGPIHRYPVDCYRFYPDSYSALAKYAGIQLVDCWLDDRGPWNDLVGVFSKTPCSHPSIEELRRAASTSDMNAYRRDRAPAVVITEPRNDEPETVRGEAPRLDVLQAVHEALLPRFYLEIGVRNGHSLALASCPSVGIDPEPGETAVALKHARIYNETSDFFFERSTEQAIGERPIDFALIDGMHFFEFALRDFMNIERLAKPTSVIAIDDIFPNQPRQASRSRESAIWTGDVWKLFHCLKAHRPDLELFPLNVSPTGLLIVANLDPRNRSLWREYNPLVRAYRDKDLRDCEALILGREEALSPTDGRLFDFLRSVRQSRAPSSQSGTPE